jgi:hypothetical protein
MAITAPEAHSFDPENPYDAPEEILHRVRDALIERGMVGVRRRFKPEWTRHIIGA